MDVDADGHEPPRDQGEDVGIGEGRGQQHLLEERGLLRLELAPHAGEDELPLGARPADRLRDGPGPGQQAQELPFDRGPRARLGSVPGQRMDDLDQPAPRRGVRVGQARGRAW